MKASLDPQRTYAILMGMTKFEGFDPIPPASRNVAQLAALLADPAVLGIPAQQIQTIIDTNSADAKRLFSKYVVEAKEAQARSLFFYYVGHGYRRTDGQYFLTTTDSDPEWINLDRSTCIDYNGVIKKILKNANLPQTIVIVDACYSGALAQGGTAHLPELDLLVSYTLTSSAAEEESFFDPTHDYTYFSAELINLLQLGLPNDSESLTLAELYEALRKNIREKGLKMAPQHRAGKELQPHLYNFCKNKAFGEIQLIEAKIKKIEYKIKNREIKASEIELNILKAYIDKIDKLESSSRGYLIERIEKLLAFCVWYLQYQAIFLNEIIENAIQLQSKYFLEQLEYFKNQLQTSDERLRITEIDLTAKDTYIKDLGNKLSSTNNLKLDLLKALNATLLNEQRQYSMISEIDQVAQYNLLNIEDTFRILFIGEFNVGKSTLINAFLGEEILPTSPLESKVPIILKYGRNKKAWLHFKDNRKVKKAVTIEKLENYISTGNNKKNNNEQGDAINHVEVWWPSDVLYSKNLEIIDLQSFNRDNVNKDIIASKFYKVDFVIFTMSATRFGPRPVEVEIINSLKLIDYDNLFFVINQFDALRPESSKDLVKSRALDVLSKLTHDKQKVFFISALDALEGRAGDKLKLERSGIREFELSLNRILIEPRVSIKLRQIARGIRKNISELCSNTIPEKINLLNIQAHEKKLMFDSLNLALNRITINQPEIINSLQVIFEENQLNPQAKITDLENFKVRLEEIGKLLGIFVDSV